jgi:hypothetical protein
VLTLGKLTVTIVSGRRKTIHISLDRTGKLLLAQRHKLSVKLKVPAGGKTISAKAFSFKTNERGTSRALRVRLAELSRRSRIDDRHLEAGIDV